VDEETMTSSACFPWLAPETTSRQILHQLALNQMC